MKHIHQLTPKQQISLIHKIHNKEVSATVKEDGSAVTVGLNHRGEPYVSREGKVGVATERFYDVSDISLEYPGVNAALYIAAKLWIHASPKWTFGGKPGDAWNCEVVSSGLNVIDYKHTSLILLHPITNSLTNEISTPLTEIALSKAMGDEIMVPTWFINAYDDIDVHFVRRHASVRSSCSAELPDVSNIVALFDCQVNGQTVESILGTKLNDIEVEKRLQIKAVRDSMSATLISMVKALEHDPEMKREGIVIKDGENLVKVVNPLFVKANQYQHAVRNCIKKRTFSNDFAKYFPTCPQPLIDDVNKFWANGELSAVEKHTLRVMLYTMEDHYVRAQHQKKLNDPTGLYDNRYPSHVHQATLLAFNLAIESLNGA